MRTIACRLLKRTPGGIEWLFAHSKTYNRSSTLLIHVSQNLAVFVQLLQLQLFLHSTVHDGSLRAFPHVIDPSESLEVIPPIQHQSSLPHATSQSVRAHTHTINNPQFSNKSAKLLGSSIHRPVRAPRNRTLALCCRRRSKSPHSVNHSILPTM